MEKTTKLQRIAILGGGPSGMFAYKRLIESGKSNLEITIFERKSKLGVGMPYSSEGANDEHITNVSDNEIPKMVTSIAEWVQTIPISRLEKYNINPKNFNEYKVLPRLLFGDYLEAQFQMLQELANEAGILTVIKLETNVTDVIDFPKEKQVGVQIDENKIYKFDITIICTGHRWPKKYEGKIPGYFDSPYPPSKLAKKYNHAIALKGSSLTAIDAIRTLARQNGTFLKEDNGKYMFQKDEDCQDFKLVMHSRNGLLPAVRFHLEDSHLSNNSLLTEEEIALHRSKNNGFLSLDFVFGKDFKAIFQEKDPDFYAQIKALTMEEFVAKMMELRERLDPFQLLKAEYAEAEKSIKRHESVYWKEMLAVLSFAMNYPAKYFSAEDMIRLQNVLMPLISIVIAFVPQRSCEDIMALHNAGVLELVAVGSHSKVEVVEKGGIVYHYQDEMGNHHEVRFATFVDCVGQLHFSYAEFPFKSLLVDQTISPAKLKFESNEKAIEALENGNKAVEKTVEENYFLNVPGIAINDNFQVLDPYGAYNERIFIMAVPYIGGFNPDYSGLDFCEAASKKIADALFTI